MDKSTQRGDFRSLDKSLKIRKIIDTAAELFHKRGYRATTLDDVAKELGLTHAALYHYVSSKEELLSEIYIQALDRIFKNSIMISQMDISPDEKLRLIIKEHIQGIIIKSLPMISVFFSEENQLPEKEFRKITKEKNKYTKIIENVIEEGISKGYFRNTDPKLEAYAIIGMCNWVYKWYKPGDNAYGPDQIVDHFIGLLESGYLEQGRNGHPAHLSQQEKAPKKRNLVIEKKELKKIEDQCTALAGLIESYLN